MKLNALAASLFGASVALAMALHATSQTRRPAKKTAGRTVFVPAMDGYEQCVISAILSEEVPVEVVTEQSYADLVVKPTFGNSLPPIDAVLYRKLTGHDPLSFFDVVEVQSKKHLLTYRFLLTNDEAKRNRNAREFAMELREKLKTM